MPTDTTAFEHHFTPHELADLWKLDASTIRRMFIDEPGVFLCVEEDGGNTRSDYMTLRIPRSVAARVHDRENRKHVDSKSELQRLWKSGTHSN